MRVIYNFVIIVHIGMVWIGKFAVHCHVRPDLIDFLLLGQNLEKKLTRVAGKKFNQHDPLPSDKKQ